MADRALDNTLVGELYSDGSTINIPYSEERSDPEMIEQFSPEGSGVTRTFYCKWEARFAFIENMVGFAKINDAGTDGITAVGAWNGRHIHRKLPIGYHMGAYTAYAGGSGTEGAGSGNFSNWVYATRAVVVPDGAKANDTDGASIYKPRATYAKVMVTFSALDYDLYTDLQVSNQTAISGSNPAVGCCREWLRYARIVQKPASIFFQYPSEALKLVDYPMVGDVGKEGGALSIKPYSKGVNVLDNIADFWLYLYDLPYDPIAAINLCFGKVNSTAIFSTPDFTEGQPAETLHLVAADIIRQPLRMSRRYWNLQLGFRKVFNTDNSPLGGGAIRGHNYVRFTVQDAAGVQRLRLYRISGDGTSSLVAGNPLIDVVDFRKLFWIQDSNIQPPALPAGP